MTQGNQLTQDRNEQVKSLNTVSLLFAYLLSFFSFHLTLLFRVCVCMLHDNA